MAYPYICKACAKSMCDDCERHRDIPSGFEGEEAMMGGGVCICRHQVTKSKFELSVMENMENDKNPSSNFR